VMKTLACPATATEQAEQEPSGFIRHLMFLR
jgi:hypothetical protein